MFEPEHVAYLVYERGFEVVAAVRAVGREEARDEPARYGVAARDVGVDGEVCLRNTVRVEEDSRAARLLGDGELRRVLRRDGDEADAVLPDRLVRGGRDVELYVRGQRPVRERSARGQQDLRARRVYVRG